jgi:WD40 repeat protein
VVNGDATISLWDLIGRHETARFPVETGTTVCATSPDGMAVVLRNADSGKVWMRRIDATNSDIQVAGARAHNSRGAFSPDGKQFAVGGSEQSLRLGATDGSTPVHVLKHPIETTTEILFSHDGSQIFTVNESGKLRVCDTVTGEIVWELAAHNRPINGIALDPGGVRLATSSLDETVGLWDLTTRRKLGSFGKSSLGYRCVTFSRDGKRIAASAGENLVQVWDVDFQREVARFKKTERIGAVRFAADDRTLVIADRQPTESLSRADLRRNRTRER